MHSRALGVLKSGWPGFPLALLVFWENDDKVGRIQQKHKKLKNCQHFFKEAYIAYKWYNEGKRQTQESINNVTTKEWKMYIEAMEVKAEQERKEQQEHIQQVTNQNAMLVTMVQE